MKSAILVIAALLATGAVAAEKDAAYYQRTGMKPPMNVSGIIGPNFNYAEGFGIGLHGGPVFDTKSAGPVALIFSADAIRINGVSGTVPPPTWYCVPQRVPIPYSTSDRTVGVYGVSVMFTIGGK